MSTFNNTPLTLNAYFDKIFYINLKKDVNRNEQILRQFNQNGIINFERVDAIQLTELPDTILYRNFIKHDHKYLLGSLSCQASHLKCIKLAKERGYKKVLILEDDVVFLTNPDHLLAQNQNVLNDWDMLYFGGLVEKFFRNQIVGAYAYAVKNTLYDNIINMAEPSGMEIDNFYAKILQHMSYNYNQSGRYNIRTIQPFNMINVDYSFNSNIQG